MRILQVSTFDIQGGAEKIARDLSAAYRRYGHQSWLAVGEKRSNDPDIYLIPNQDSRGNWFNFWRSLASRLPPSTSWQKSLRRLAGGLAEPSRAFDFLRGLEDFHFPGTARLLALASPQPDILHCHNLHGGYFDLRMLPWLSRQAPLVLTLHDAWLLSGHCAHSFGCERWKTGCGSCPDLTIYPAIRRDATALNWQRKKEIFTRSRLYIATPSRWLLEKVEQSMLAPSVIEARVLPNGVDLGVFYPGDQKAARAALRISQDAQVLLTTGVMMRQNIWKDYMTLRNAVALAAAQRSEQDLLLIVLGEEAPTEWMGRAEIRFIPYQKDPHTLARYYQAADVYVHAARADTFPSSVLEAMACGTPVVATAVGGIPEQVEDACTGYLVPPGDVREFANRTTQLLSDEALKRIMGSRAAERARLRFSFDQLVDGYLNWYIELTWDSKGMLSSGRSYAQSSLA